VSQRNGARVGAVSEPGFRDPKGIGPEVQQAITFCLKSLKGAAVEVLTDHDGAARLVAAATAGPKTR
jgi:hypothetical protein